MNKILKMLIVAAFILAGLALWALGAHLAWSAESVLAAAAALTVVGLVMSL